MEQSTEPFQCKLTISNIVFLIVNSSKKLFDIFNEFNTDDQIMKIFESIKIYFSWKNMVFDGKIISQIQIFRITEHCTKNISALPNKLIHYMTILPIVHFFSHKFPIYNTDSTHIFNIEYSSNITTIYNITKTLLYWECVFPTSLILHLYHLHKTYYTNNLELETYNQLLKPIKSFDNTIEYICLEKILFCLNTLMLIDNDYFNDNYKDYEEYIKFARNIYDHNVHCLMLYYIHTIEQNIKLSGKKLMYYNLIFDTPSETTVNAIISMGKMELFQNTMFGMKSYNFVSWILKNISQNYSYAREIKNNVYKYDILEIFLNIHDINTFEQYDIRTTCLFLSKYYCPKITVELYPKLSFDGKKYMLLYLTKLKSFHLINLIKKHLYDTQEYNYFSRIWMTVIEQMSNNIANIVDEVKQKYLSRNITKMMECKNFMNDSVYDIELTNIDYMNTLITTFSRESNQLLFSLFFDNLELYKNALRREKGKNWERFNVNLIDYASDCLILNSPKCFDHVLELIVKVVESRIYSFSECSIHAFARLLICDENMYYLKKTIELSVFPHVINKRLVYKCMMRWNNLSIGQYCLSSREDYENNMDFVIELIINDSAELFEKSTTLEFINKNSNEIVNLVKRYRSCAVLRCLRAMENFNNPLLSFNTKRIPH